MTSFLFYWIDVRTRKPRNRIIFSVHNAILVVTKITFLASPYRWYWVPNKAIDDPVQVNLTQPLREPSNDQWSTRSRLIRRTRANVTIVYNAAVPAGLAERKAPSEGTAAEAHSGVHHNSNILATRDGCSGDQEAAGQTRRRSPTGNTETTPRGSYEVQLRIQSQLGPSRFDSWQFWNFISSFRFGYPFFLVLPVRNWKLSWPTAKKNR